MPMAAMISGFYDALLQALGALDGWLQGRLCCPLTWRLWPLMTRESVHRPFSLPVHPAVCKLPCIAHLLPPYMAENMVCLLHQL